MYTALMAKIHMILHKIRNGWSTPLWKETAISHIYFSALFYKIFILALWMFSFDVVNITFMSSSLTVNINSIMA